MNAVVRRLTELAGEHSLDAAALARLEALLAHLAAEDHAPTPIRRPEEAIDAHVADSLAGLGVAALGSADRIADLGAGAGFPGLVLAAARPQAEVTLVESSRRKAEWIATAARAAGIENAHVETARVEEWRAGAQSCSAVTARALAALPVLVEYAAPLLRPGGVLVSWKGAPDAEEEAAGAAAADQLGLTPREVVRVRPFAGVRDRRLYVYKKVAETPAGFPRRPGVAGRRPLGSDRACR